MENEYKRILVLVKVDYGIFQKQLREESKPKGLFRAFRKQPDLMDIAMMAEGYKHALSFIEICTDELSAFETLDAGIEDLERQVREADNQITGATTHGMLKGWLMALAGFHKAMKFVHGGNYSWPSGEEQKILEIFQRFGLHSAR